MVVPRKFDEKRNRCRCLILPKSVCFFVMVLVLLCSLDHTNSQPSQSAAVDIDITTFRCLEVNLLIVRDEDLTVTKPLCKFQVSSQSRANYSFSRHSVEYKFSKEVSKEDQMTTKECFNATRTEETQGYLVLNFDKRQVRFKEFLKATCSRLSQICKICTQSKTNPYQINEEYKLNVYGGHCPIRIRIIHDHTNENCNVSGDNLLCTAERNKASRDKNKLCDFANCGITGKKQVRIDLLYRHPVSLQPMRKSSPYDGVGLTFENTSYLRHNATVCDILTMEMLQLVPELADHDLRVLVLLHFQLHDQTNNWTHTTRIQAIRLLRDRHELHLQACNATDDPTPLTFNYKNMTGFATKTGYFHIENPNETDYYSSSFWKDSRKLKTDTSTQLQSYFSVNEDKVTVGRRNNSLKQLVCQTLFDYLQTGPIKPSTMQPYRVEELALVLQLDVSTALSINVTRHWTVSVMFAYIVDIHPNPSKQVKCFPGKVQPQLAELRIPVSEKYHEKHKLSKHLWSTCIQSRCPRFAFEDNNGRTIQANSSRLQLLWKPEQAIYYTVKTSIERANGPQHQLYIQVFINISLICDFSWLSELDINKKVASVKFHITKDLIRNDTKNQFLSSPSISIEKRIVRAFASDDNLYEVSCDSNDTFSYWLEDSSLRVTALSIDKIEFPYAPYYTWKFGDYYELYSEVLSVQGYDFENYFTPSSSKELEIVKQQLCKRLEHLPVSALGLNYVPSNNAIANLSLEYEVTARFCEGTSSFSSCFSETARIRLQLLQKTFKPWVFDSIKCDDEQNANSSRKLNFTLREVHKGPLTHFSLSNIEILSCSQITVVETWGTSGFIRRFPPEACETLRNYFVEHIKSEQINSSFDLTIVLHDVSLTCEKLYSSELFKKDSKVYIKVPFRLQSEAEDRVWLIMIDYKPNTAELNDQQIIMSTKTLELSDLQDDEEQPREQVQLSEGVKQKNVTDSDVTGDHFVSVLNFFLPLWNVFLILLLVLLHYAYVASKWKSYDGCKVADKDQFVTPAQIIDIPKAPPEQVPEANEPVYSSIEHVLGEIRTVRKFNHQKQVDKKALSSCDFKQLVTLPNQRDQSFSLESIKATTPHPFYKSKNNSLRQEVNSPVTPVGSKKVPLNAPDVAKLNNQASIEEEGYFTLDYSGIANKNCHAWSTFAFSHVLEEDELDES